MSRLRRRRSSRRPVEWGKFESPPLGVIIGRMCGRFTLRTPARDMVEIFELLREPDLTPRFNIAPTQQVLVVRPDNKAREWTSMRWGLVPSWARESKSGPPMINARAETIATKPAFRTAFKKRRCLIPADGFYEWQKTGGKTKVPHYIRLADDRPFAFAGLWESRRVEDDSRLESCTIITCEPNTLMAELHDRMPVILPGPCGRPGSARRASVAPRRSRRCWPPTPPTTWRCGRSTSESAMSGTTIHR
jgi:putative SOS response-associated peptidase YedK